MSLKVALVSDGLSKSELNRRAREIVQNSGANSEERFNRVVLGDVTFCQQVQIYLQTATTRKRTPLRDVVSVEGALKKWAFPLNRGRAARTGGQSHREASHPENARRWSECENGEQVHGIRKTGR